MPIADRHRPLYNYQDYLLWEGRWELIEGIPYAMSPAPVPGHQKLNGRLWSIFDNALRTACNECEVYLPIDWKIDENTVVQPDLLIVCHKIAKKYLDFTPSLVVEILSPATSYKDRHEKFELYQQAGVLFYIIIDPMGKKIEIYERKGQQYYPAALSPANAAFALPNGCRFTVDIEKIWT